MIALLVVSLFGAALAQGPNVANPVYLSSPNVTCDDIKFIVDYHNHCRRKLANGTLPYQPKAANMQTMVWDKNLARIATEYSKKMIFAHNPLRKDSRFSVGENLFMSAQSNSKNTVINWKRAIDAWFDEHILYDFQPAAEDPETGHYTQVIWADTIYVGCGTTHFLDKRNWIYKYYVCNYGPTGNWYGNYPYIEDSGTGDIEILISYGILPPDTVIPEPINDLLCDKGQCDVLYGPDCPA